MKQEPKVYIEIVQALKRMIEVDRLQIGDKIPSERELSERLNVGRSSVREALRALELLGIIETRRGEGTFLKDFTEHHLIELLGNFVLQDNQAKNDVRETKLLLEQIAVQLCCQRLTEKNRSQLSGLLEEREISREHCMKTILSSSQNKLLLKIWILLNEYDQLSFPNEDPSTKFCPPLIKAIIDQNEREAITIYLSGVVNTLTTTGGGELPEIPDRFI